MNEFRQMGGATPRKGYPLLHAPVMYTDQGTPYLQTPGVALLARTQISMDSLVGFLHSYGEGSHFDEYLSDPDPLPDSGQLCKVAGQLCYMSFGRKRTMNRDAWRYFLNILEQCHGSLLEHATFSFLLYGISRSVTHELVRHRHLSISQQSQRYVSGKMVRFVERPEYVNDEELHTKFLARIDQAAQEHASLTEQLLEMQQEGAQILSAEARTDLRKKVQQTARSLLPNETEAPLIVTGNARAWRHILSMRGSAHAETEIRELAVRIFLGLKEADPFLFGDFSLEQLPDGTLTVSTLHEKV